jgi:hypothetical protein
MPTPPRPPEHRGFALVVTLALVALLLVISIGLLSLSSITLRSAGTDFARQEARANARLGLMLALGELQRALGPDRRVSAPAGVLDSSPDTPAIDGVKHPHWTAVWSTEWSDGKTPWVRDDRAGGLRDRRATATWQPRDQVANYLVSGNEGSRGPGKRPPGWLDARTADLAREQVALVGQGTVADPTHEVFAKRVTVGQGAYAFWIGDLGVKANVARADPHRGKSPGQGPEGIERLLHAQDTGEETVADLGSIDPADGERLPSYPTLGVLPDVGREALKLHYHELTAYSRSVLANVRDGGLQRDLSAYLDSSGIIAPLTSGGKTLSPGISDTDRMAGPANAQAARDEGLVWTHQRYRDIAPCFGLLRRWALQAQRTPFSQSGADLQPPAALRDSRLLAAMQDDVNVYDRSNLSPASFTPLDQPNLAPVMVEGAMYYNLATFSDNSTPSSPWVVRFCMYPRVALWNPYNIEMKLPQTVAMLFINGNKQVRLIRADRSVRDEGIPFGRGSVSGSPHPAHYRGTVLWTLPAITLDPGETVVFSAARSGRYDLNNVANNLLSPTLSPDPSRYYYQDMERRHSQAPVRFFEYPRPGNSSGTDNNVMALKRAGSGPVSDSAFDSLPQVVYANLSPQAGGGDELPVQWRSSAEVPVHRLGGPAAVLPGHAVPDVRTRDGFRLRWWREHPSNEAASGQLSRHPRHLQSAALANWNPRAAYFCRTPWENLSNEPPYFHGIYTRDMFDSAVSWQEMAPRASKGKQLGFPFGPPQEGPDALVLFELPRRETGIPSLAYFRHLKVSEFGWHPAYAIGNSLADPRVPRTGTSPPLSQSRDSSSGGWNASAFGWDGGDPGYWALLTRQILFDRPVDNNVVYDLSFELNHTLWDGCFLSTGSAPMKAAFFLSPADSPLPFGRIGLFSRDGRAAEEISDFHRAATRLSLEGGFNVHSIGKEAWKALLTSTRDTGFGSESATPFPRSLTPPGDEWLGGDATDENAANGFRSLSDPEIDRLATELVAEVKRRAPFFGLGDFINRRLRSDRTGLEGPIQAAIDAAGLNSAFQEAYPLDNSSDLPHLSFLNIGDATRLDQTLLPDSTAWGLPAFLTQGDILQVIGSTLRARSDSFVIRTYGESRGSDGKIAAKAWCEAVVQRFPDPLQPDPLGLNPAPTPGHPDFGRRFRIVSFRWLSPSEV